MATTRDRLVVDLLQRLAGSFRLDVAVGGRPAAIVSRLYAAVAEHHDLDRLDGDVTFMVVRQRGQEVKNPKSKVQS